MKRPGFNFNLGLLALGCLLLGAMAFDLIYRGLDRHPHAPLLGTSPANPGLGAEAIVEFGCGACHVIPGIRGATGRVGPQLADFVHQSYIAGVLPNDAPNLVRWIQFPRQIDPQTAMPNLGVSEEQARHIAAYLYAQDD